MKVNYYLTLCMLLVGLGMSSCKSSSTKAFYTFETECMSDELDGSVVLRAWGQGASRTDAMEQAKKKALRAVIFEGIKKGQCTFKPLLFEVNAEEKYQAYFNNFFGSGEYAHFVKMDATKMNSGVKAESKTRNSYAVVIRVLRADLEQKLISDNILKK